ncbi:ABC transporter permease [Leptotrichia sp. OH3620_COT-345]|uniref:ABC transporter permease n=1 Tax=Leptotrichia sp. OH3620_COT-345 TaxID=2491048 RepID=UPI000F650DA2|nr:ABC transporter permease [Leptotrichia sp. OH3620_COT-345]RRD40882.1 ABC transporter permease [Leptotrichia sp. OH3620_COT-345]
MGKFLSVIDYTIIHATIRATTPILLAAFAAVITQQADILNVGVEGIMLMGAFIAVYTSVLTGSWIIAVIAAVISGVVIAAIMGVAHLKYKGDIFAVGTTVNLLVLALTRFLLQKLLGVSGSYTLKEGTAIPQIHFKIFESNKILNSLFNDYSLFEILSIPLIIFFWFLLYKTVWGLRTRSIGLNPEAAKTAGINVYRRKFEVILISGIIGGLAGAHLSLGYSNLFTENMTNGRGFMGVAAMFFGAANPIFTAVGCMIFGFTDSVGARLQAYGFPSQIILMLPYIITILILSISMIKQYQKDKKRRSSIKA